ncbi:MAG TPA: 5'-nucleotidase [Coxiellaceae bacterium]|nr:5'-nucleotidase [Coxiellaceae bacterium]
MPEDISHKLIIAISSRALFDLTQSNEIYEKEGVEKYAQYQIENESKILEPGVAFSLVQKLLHLNETQDLVEVILLSRNSADTGLRVFNSIQHYGLTITRAAFTSGESPYRYIQAFGAHLFLSAHSEDVKHALNANCAAATLLPMTKPQSPGEEIRIAFDGDSVLFSDESERIYQTEGLKAFQAKEKAEAHIPLPGGPFKGFLAQLHRIQKLFPEKACPIHTALVTARQAPAHERVVRTLREWDIRIDQALFLGGLNKTEFLRSFGADIFFDDQRAHCERASEHIATGHVPTGIINGNPALQE